MIKGFVRILVLVVTLSIFATIQAAENVLSEATKHQSESIPTLKSDPEKNIEKHTDIGVTNYIQMLLGLFFIIAFIFAIAWVIKRMGNFNPTNTAQLKVIAGLNVGQKEKIIVVEVMQEQLLLGVTQSNINFLSKLEQPIDSSQASTGNSFQDKLQSAVQGFRQSSQKGDS